MTVLRSSEGMVTGASLAGDLRDTHLVRDADSVTVLRGGQGGLLAGTGRLQEYWAWWWRVGSSCLPREGGRDALSV